jgi:hypothetical protein
MAQKSLYKSDVGNAGQALAYLVECTLATVDRLVMLKNPSKGELERQIGIAQAGLSWMKDYNVEPSGRGWDVATFYEWSVRKYANAIRVECGHPALSL